MDDNSFIETLKQKRLSHLRESERQKALAENIENLIKEYSTNNQEDTDNQINLNPLDTIDVKESIDLHDLNLTEAIVSIMQSKPSKSWRGAEIKKILEIHKYDSNNLGPKISARLSERAKSSKGKWKRIENPDGIPRYILKQEYRNN